MIGTGGTGQALFEAQQLFFCKQMTAHLQIAAATSLSPLASPTAV